MRRARATIGELDFTPDRSLKCAPQISLEHSRTPPGFPFPPVRVAIYLVLPAGLKKLKPKEERRERRFLLLAFLLAFAFAALLPFLLAKPDSGATGCSILEKSEERGNQKWPECASGNLLSTLDMAYERHPLRNTLVLKLQPIDTKTYLDAFLMNIFWCELDLSFGASCLRLPTLLASPPGDPEAKSRSVRPGQRGGAE